MEKDAFVAQIENLEFGILRANFSYPIRNFHVDYFDYRRSELLHYTNLSGLIGIVKSRGFWLSDARFLNDSQEYLNGAKLAEWLLNELVKRRRYQFFSGVLRLAQKQALVLPSNASFICSFAMESDSLNHWRSYAAGSGVALVLDLDAKQLTKLPMFSPQKVIYDDRQKLIRLLRIVRVYAKEYQKDQSNGKRVEDDDWAQHLVQSLTSEFLLFKHSAFASEREVRLIAHEIHLPHFGGIEHRVVGNRIVPYLLTADVRPPETDAPQLAISKVLIGPSADQALMATSVRALLKNVGLLNVAVVESEVPFRS